MTTETPESIARYNAGIWPYANGYRIERCWGSVHVIIDPNGDRGMIGGLGACHEWLTSRDIWPAFPTRVGA